jgi:polyisoprenoid-binding protein YceI
MKKSILVAALATALPLAGLISAQAATPAKKAAPAKAAPHAGHEGHAMVDVSKVSGGDYTTDQNHTQVMWTINHLGFNDYFGLFGQITGKLSLDKANPANSKVSITIPVNELATSRADLTKHMLTADFLNAPQFANATFESTKVEVMGQNAKITGNLTLLGVTKPVTLDARLSGAGNNMMSKKETIGFHARTTIKRSEFGMTKFLPAVGDEVSLGISAAFEK